MKKAITAIILIILIIAIGAGGYYYYNTHIMGTTAFNESNKILQTLKEGNQRFVAGKPRKHDYEKQILNTKDAQHPEAVVLACMDSRSIPELAFDQGVGHIFTIRVAGNVINKDILGSMEYGTKVAGAKLIIVMGHTNCGAVAAACHGESFGNLGGLLGQIQPAVQTTEATLQKSDCSDKSLVNAIAKQNVINMVKAIPQQSQLIAELVKEGKVKIVGAMYDVSTGKVTFFDQSPSGVAK